jgi:hypothetical protein
MTDPRYPPPEFEEDEFVTTEEVLQELMQRVETRGLLRGRYDTQDEFQRQFNEFFGYNNGSRKARGNTEE